MIETPDDPVAAARAAGLRYTPDVGPGITRRRAGKGWSYIDPDGAVIRDPEELQRIRALVDSPRLDRRLDQPEPARPHPGHRARCPRPQAVPLSRQVARHPG